MRSGEFLSAAGDALARVGSATRDVGWRTVKNFVDQEGVQWSGAVAFYLVLSVPPLLIAAFSVGVAVVGEETARGYITDQVVQFLPAQQDVVRQIVGRTISSTGVAIPVSLAFLLFSGSRVFASLIAAINLMWRELPESGFVRRQVVRVVMLLTTGMLFALAGALDLGVALAGDLLPLALAQAIQGQVLPAALLAAALFLLFKIVPRNSASASSALIGALVGTGLLRIAQAGFTAYLVTIGNFESAYGPIAGAAVLMTWALVASAVILLAAHLVAVLNDADSRKQPQSGDHRAPGEEQAR